jgi:multidrug efflux pump subunit AcrB
VNRLIAWFAGNPVAANLLMLGVAVAGLLVAPGVKQEVFPEAALGMITVSVVHEGAAPDEVESGLCVPIEEAIHGIPGVHRVTATAVEGLCTVAAELERRADSRRVLEEIKAKVDGVDHLPEEAEAPVVQELFSWNPVIDVAVHGEADERTLKRLGEKMRDELLALPGVAKVELTGVRPDEIAIEVAEAELRRHGLLFDDVVAAVRRSSVDLPGGSLRTPGGEILLRAQGQAKWGGEFERIVLFSRPDGTRLHLADVARVVDGFAETDQRARLNGERAVVLHVLRESDGRLIDIAETVKAEVREAQVRMPAGLVLSTRQDHSEQLASRRDLMLENGAQGLLLVLASLALFLRARLALWVSAGILVSFLGAVALMPLLDVSLNMISSLGFIVALGLVADDAIVVGERITRHVDRGAPPLRAAVRGAQEVGVPVAIAALTTMVALSPAVALPGVIGTQGRAMPLVAVACLAFSLVESLLILPAHLAHGRARAGRQPLERWDRFQGRFAAGLERFVHGPYRRALAAALRERALTLAAGWFVFAATLGAVVGGWIPFTFLPKTEADHVTAILTLPRGTPVEVTDRIARRLEAAAARLGEELDEPGAPGVVRDVYTSIGQQPEKMSQNFFTPLAWSRFSGAHVAEVQIALAPAEARSLSAAEIGNRWRELTGPVPDADELLFVSSFFSTAAPINVQLGGRDFDALEGAAEALAARLRGFAGVRDVATSYQRGKRELELEVLPEAEAYGLSLAAVARQVRQAFHGEEVQRIQRGREDVEVVVRYPAAQRRSLGDLEQMWIRTPQRDPIPFSAVARARTGRGYGSIQRADRRRTVNVTADVDAAVANANQIMEVVEASVLPAVLADHPGVSYGVEGQQRDQREFMGTLGRLLLGVQLAIFVLLAMPLRSYLQPLLILLAVPFGLVGAVWGHALLGLDLTAFSMIGFVGLTGVVVNDSLVLLHSLNALRRRGLALEEAVERACLERFRPILVTTLTTCLGLTPLLFETSTQARWIRPMAVSLAFGELFSTLVVLFLVPAAALWVGGSARASHEAAPRLAPVSSDASA